MDAYSGCVYLRLLHGVRGMEKGEGRKGVVYEVPARCGGVIFLGTNGASTEEGLRVMLCLCMTLGEQKTVDREMEMFTEFLRGNWSVYGSRKGFRKRRNTVVVILCLSVACAFTICSIYRSYLYNWSVHHIIKQIIIQCMTKIDVNMTNQDYI